MLFTKAGAASMAVWPVHGSYSGWCGRCVIYTDPPRYASNRPLYLRDAIPILNTELGVRVTLILILILSLSLRVAVRKDCILCCITYTKNRLPVSLV